MGVDDSSNRNNLNLTPVDNFSFLARLYEVQRAIIVTSVVCVPVQWHSVPVTLRLSFLEVHVLVTTCQKAFMLAP